METTFEIQQEAFVGPVEVLLELIEKRKLFVNDVSLASVTDDFLSYMQTRGMEPSLAANFMSVAATLILIKARSLLPNIELTTEESESITDLERRVALYQIIQDAAGTLIKAYGKRISFEGPTRPSGPVFAPDLTLTADILPGLIGETVNRIPPAAPAKPEAKVYATISLGEVLETLHERIQRAMAAFTFNDIQIKSPDADEKSRKVYTIVSFLGMLELVRRGFLDADQGEQFETINLTKPTSNEQ